MDEQLEHPIDLRPVSCFNRFRFVTFPQNCWSLRHFRHKAPFLIVSFVALRFEVAIKSAVCKASLPSSVYLSLMCSEDQWFSRDAAVQLRTRLQIVLRDSFQHPNMCDPFSWENAGFDSPCDANGDLESIWHRSTTTNSEVDPPTLPVRNAELWELWSLRAHAIFYRLAEPQHVIQMSLYRSLWTLRW